MRKEIQDETDRETGRTKQISSVPIHLSIYSPNGAFEFCFSVTMLSRSITLSVCLTLSDLFGLLQLLT